MDMEQRTSLLMDCFFWGGKISWTYPKFPIEFLYDEIIVFSGESDSKEMLIHSHMLKIMFVIFHTPTYQLRILRGSGLRFESKEREGKKTLSQEPKL